MDIQYHFNNDMLVVDVLGVEGRVAAGDIDEFIDQIFKLCSPASRSIALNMSDKTFLNSSGLGELIKIKDRLLDRSMDLVLINPGARVQSLIDMVGVDQFFKIVKKEDDL